ncbi:hypothetical protein FO519_010123 [Halicephalobus sp. NKZ332]|nr:hypothetical protein FO519_010123 [Halicephalobus sp. NKZ332]
MTSKEKYAAVPALYEAGESTKNLKTFSRNWNSHRPTQKRASKIRMYTKEHEDHPRTNPTKSTTLPEENGQKSPNRSQECPDNGQGEHASEGY